MVRVICMSTVPTSDGPTRAKAGAWQTGADGHAWGEVPVDDEDHETVLARRRAARRAEAACTRRGKSKSPDQTKLPAVRVAFGQVVS